MRAILAHGPIDILVNNAGVVYYGPTENMTGKQWDWLLGINLLAPVQLTRELLPTLLARPDAHVLNVCSVSGLVAGSRIAAYHTSKFGLVGFTESLRAEFGRRGLGVTALCPGPVTSNLYKKGISGREDRPVPNPPRWLCASSDAVARIALRAMRRDRRMVLITPLAHLLYNVKRFAPWLLDLLNRISRKRRKPSMESVPIRPARADEQPSERRRRLSRACRAMAFRGASF